MTEYTIDRDNKEVPKYFITIVAIAIMAFGLYLTGLMLKWAINHRMSNPTVAETTDITTAMRERQLQCLALNIYREAGGEPFEGKVAVAQVTLNRADARGFPDDICQVIYQKNIVYEKVICQFSWTCDRQSGLKPKNSASYQESMNVAKKVLLEGFRLPSLKDAMYFHGDYINPGWKRKKVAHIGRHIFYE